jgi:hypothetical protein
MVYANSKIREDWEPKYFVRNSVNCHCERSKAIHAYGFVDVFGLPRR